VACNNSNPKVKKRKKEKGALEDVSIDGRIRLRWIVKRMLSGSIWLRLGTNGRLW
jgi:lysophospholipase L1-like esterase